VKEEDGREPPFLPHSIPYIASFEVTGWHCDLIIDLGVFFWFGFGLDLVCLFSVGVGIGHWILDFVLIFGRGCWGC
jgi:hypothetical protein